MEAFLAVFYVWIAQDGFTTYLGPEANTVLANHGEIYRQIRDYRADKNNQTLSHFTGGNLSRNMTAEKNKAYRTQSHFISA